MDGKAGLIRLKAELAARGWSSEIREANGGPVLFVRNPDEPTINERIVCADGRYPWPGGQPIGPVDDVHGTAGAIAHVLRTVSP